MTSSLSHLSLTATHMFCQRFLVPVLCLRIPTRGTVWPSNYIDPIFKPEEQKGLDDDDKKKLSFVPVKAARNNKSSSVFYDPTIWRLTTLIMRNGRMFLARENMDKTFYEIKKAQLQRIRSAKTPEEREAIETDPVVIVKQAIENMMPVVITKPIKRGGATYQVPQPISPTYAQFLAMKWLLDSVKDRPKPRKESFWTVLSRELLAGYNNDGKIVRKKLDMHRACEANKAYAHYRWG